jgi:hypothetical protein
MTKRERSSRPDRLSRERFPDALLDRYLLDRSSRDSGSGDRGGPDRGLPDRDALPDGDPARSQPVARVLTALTSAPESSELTGEARAIAEFRAFAGSGAFAAAPARGPDLRPPAPRRDPRRTTWLPGGRLAVAAATGAVLMGGLLAVAYAGELPVAVQRLAHHTIDAPAARPDRDPAVSPQMSGSPHPAGQAGQQTTHALVRPDREVPSGSGSGHPHRQGASSSPSASAPGRLGSGRPGSGQPGSGRLGSGRQGDSGRPGRAGEPGPVQAPWPSASVSPPPSATPSPSAAPSPSQSAPPYPQQSPSGSQSPSSPGSTPP